MKSNCIPSPTLLLVWARTSLFLGNSRTPAFWAKCASTREREALVLHLVLVILMRVGLGEKVHIREARHGTLPAAGAWCILYVILWAFSTGMVP